MNHNGVLWQLVTDNDVDGLRASLVDPSLASQVKVEEARIECYPHASPNFAFHSAAFLGMTEMVKAFLDYEANVNMVVKFNGVTCCSANKTAIGEFSHS